MAMVLVAATALLWFAEALPPAALAAASLASLGALWMIGAVMQGRVRPGTALVAEAAVGALLGAALAAGLQVG